MSETQEQNPNLHSFCIKMQYTEQRDIVVHVFDRENRDTEEVQIFTKVVDNIAVNGIHAIRKEIIEFIGAALVRITKPDNNPAAQRSPVKLFNLADDENLKQGIKLEGDESIKEIFGTKSMLMDNISTQLIKFINMGKEAAGVTVEHNALSKFYMIQNRAVAFTDKVPDELKVQFMEKADELVVELKKIRAVINSNPLGISSEEPAPADVQQQINLMTKEIQKMLDDMSNVDPLIFHKKVVDLNAFRKQHSITSGYDIFNKDPRDALEEMERWKLFKKYIRITHRQPVKASVVPKHNIADIDINMDTFLRKNFGDARFDQFIKICASMYSVITTQLYVANTMKDAQNFPDEAKVRFILDLDIAFQDYLKEQNISPIEALALGYMLRVSYEAVPEISMEALGLSNKEAIKEFIKNEMGKLP